MKTGIIGLPQVGKTSLFKILTKVDISSRGHSNPREAHLGIAKVPDDRLDRLAVQYNPKKLTHAVVEYVDVAAIGQDALKETAFLTNLRTVDALAHVLRAFDDPSIPHVGPNDPLRDAKNVDFDLIVSDLGQVEKRLERLEKDLKKMKTAELERENDLIIRAKAHLEKELPLREMEITADDEKRIRGFMFLSQKPILYVLNVNESQTLGDDLENAVAKFGLQESGLTRLIRKTYELLGVISFFTIGEDECRAWTVPRNSRAQNAAGAIHSDLEKHFIRAETIHWDKLLEAGSEANARSKGT